MIDGGDQVEQDSCVGAEDRNQRDATGKQVANGDTQPCLGRRIFVPSGKFGRAPRNRTGVLVPRSDLVGANLSKADPILTEIVELGIRQQHKVPP